MSVPIAKRRQRWPQISWQAESGDLERSNVRGPRCRFRLAHRTRAVWQCRPVPTLSGLVPTRACASRLRRLQLHRPAATGRKRSPFISARIRGVSWRTDDLPDRACTPGALDCPRPCGWLLRGEAFGALRHAARPCVDIEEPVSVFETLPRPQDPVMRPDGPTPDLPAVGPTSSLGQAGRARPSASASRSRAARRRPASRGGRGRPAAPDPSGCR